MTTKRTFECNVCHSPIFDARGRGFSFGSDRVEWKALFQAENHICNHCIKALEISFRDSGIQELIDEGNCK